MKKEKATTKICKHCKTEIPKDAKICPHCQKKQRMGLVGKIIIAFVVIVILGSALGDSDSSTEEKNTTKVTDTKTADAAETSVETKESASDSNLTMGQKNALKSAESYLDFSAFSYNGLIGQLEYEGYTTEEATFAANNCGADWNEQALQKALDYLDFSAFSYSGLIGQLEYDEFTTEQATYAVDNCGADWNEQAVEKAKDYLDYSSFSRAELIDQLIYEGFSPEQAEYGVAGAGY